MDQDRFDRSKRLDWFDLDKVRGARIAVIGCGAIGNEVCKDLILSGFQRMSLVDMDMVEGSNLNRCLFFSEDDAKKGLSKVEAVKRGLLSLDPSADIQVHHARIEELGEDFLKGFDVIVGCLDNIAARVHVNSHCMAAGIPYVDGATDGMLGKVQVVRTGGPCLECNMNKSHMKVLDLRRSCTGDKVTFFEPRLAAEITTTSVVAAVQVREVVKLVHGLHDKVMEGVLYYDGMRNETSVLEVETNPRCPHHGKTKDDGARTMTRSDERTTGEV
jgi:molybdopterin/thiamine biosynthesis adenylyltransferase